MPNYTQWPTAQDAQNVLVSANLWPSNAAQVAAAQTQLIIATDAVIETVCRQTGWTPFLAWLRGTVSKTASSAVVTGQGTRFLSDGYLTPGAVIKIPGGATESGTVLSIDSDNQITLTAAMQHTATNQQAYALDTRRVADQPDTKGILNLRAGLVDTVTNVPTVQIIDTTGAVAYSYSLSQPDQNVFLRQADAQNQRYPYDNLYFPWIGVNRYRPWPNQLTVTGRWGFCLSLPADLWLAVSEMAAASTLKRIPQAAQGNIRSQSQEGISQSFGSNYGPTDRVAAWEANFMDKCSQYQRVIF